MVTYHSLVVDVRENYNYKTSASRERNHEVYLTKMAGRKTSSFKNKTNLFSDPASQSIPNYYVRSETNLFGEPGYDVSLQSTSEVEYHPLSSPGDSGPITFSIPGNDSQYIDFSETKLYIKCRIRDGGKASIATDLPQIAVVNNF